MNNDAISKEIDDEQFQARADARADEAYADAHARSSVQVTVTTDGTHVQGGDAPAELSNRGRLFCQALGEVLEKYGEPPVTPQEDEAFASIETSESEAVLTAVDSIMAISRLSALEQHQAAVLSLAYRLDQAYCAELGQPQEPLEELTPEHCATLRYAVEFYWGGAHTAEEAHAAWVDRKIAAGWSWSAVKQEAQKKHPRLVSWSALAPEQRMRYVLFRAVVTFVSVPQEQA